MGITDEAEIYPTRDQHAWSDDLVTQYFRSRFRQHGGASSRYWRAVHRIAADVLEMQANRVRAGEDYALTEVVRCKSRREFGVATAAPVCARRYPESTFVISGAAIVIVLGSTACRLLAARVGGLAPGALIENAVLGGRTRLVLARLKPDIRRRLSKEVRLSPSTSPR